MYNVFSKLMTAAGLLAMAVMIMPQTAAANTWNGYHWARTSNPFRLQLADNVSKQWDKHLAGASADWSKSSVLDTVIVQPKGANKTCQPTLGRVEVCNSAYGDTGWLGLTTVWADANLHITQATTKLNDTYFNTPQYNTSAWRNEVMCHELGHTLGLDHQDEDFTNANLGTCLDYTSQPETNQHPNQVDYDTLEQIYAHLDSTTTLLAGTTSSRGASIIPDEQTHWGKEIHTSANGRSSVFRKHFDDGTDAYLFVTWTDSHTK